MTDTLSLQGDMCDSLEENTTLTGVHCKRALLTFYGSSCTAISEKMISETVYI